MLLYELALFIVATVGVCVCKTDRWVNIWGAVMVATFLTIAITG